MTARSVRHRELQCAAGGQNLSVMSVFTYPTKWRVPCPWALCIASPAAVMLVSKWLIPREVSPTYFLAWIRATRSFTQSPR